MNLPAGIDQDRRRREPMWKLLVGPAITLLIAGIGLAATWGNVSARLAIAEQGIKDERLERKESLMEIKKQLDNIERDVKLLLIANAIRDNSKSHQQ